MGWDNDSFLDAFKDNKLRRKTQHGNLYVLDFEHCRILMQKAVDGHQVVGLYFSNDLVIFNEHANVLSRVMFTPEFPIVLPHLPTQLQDSGLIDSQDIELSDGKITISLVDIGEKQYLFDMSFSSFGKIKVEHFLNPKLMDLKETDLKVEDFYRRRKLSPTLREVSPPSDSVKSARETLVPNYVNSESFLWNGWWFTPMPKDFEPEGISDEQKKILLNPPEPMAYDLPESAIKRESGTSYYDSENEGFRYAPAILCESEWDLTTFVSRNGLEVGLGTKLFNYYKILKKYNEASRAYSNLFVAPRKIFRYGQPIKAISLSSVLVEIVKEESESGDICFKGGMDGPTSKIKCKNWHKMTRAK